MVSDLNIFAPNGLKSLQRKKFWQLFLISSLHITGLFAPTSQSPMSNFFLDFLKFLGKTNGKRWSQINTFAHKRCKIAAQKEVWFLTNFALLAGFFWCYYPQRSTDVFKIIIKNICFNFFLLHQNALKNQNRNMDLLIWNLFL